MKRKILIIVENETVPRDPRVWKEAQSLSEAGYEVNVISPRGKGGSKGYEEIGGIRIYRHPAPKEGNSLFAYCWEYGCSLFWEFIYSWWIYFRHGFQVIQGCNPPDDIFLVALPFKLLGVKYIYDHHDADPELYQSKYKKRGLVYKILVLLERFTYASSDVVMATNASYRDLAVNRGRMAPEDVFIVRNGPNSDTVRAVAPNPALKRGKAHLVGYVGHMGFQDGLDILIEVARHIRDLGRTDIHFTCVGQGPELPNLRRMVEEKGLLDTVNFTGRVSDQELIEILSTADVCVNPDRPCEMNDISTMIKIMEYMAVAKPIVQFDLKEGRFSAGAASLYASKVDQVSDFADKILWLLERPEERKRMGDYGRKRVEEELAWKYSVRPLLVAYERAFEKRGSPARDAAQTTTDFGTSRPLFEYFRCPKDLASLAVRSSLSSEAGFFQLDPGIICYGRLSEAVPSRDIRRLPRLSSDSVQVETGRVTLPFDISEVADNLRYERYMPDLHGPTRTVADKTRKRLYYAIRPYLPVSVRRHLQRAHFGDWKAIPFPQWPTDFSVDSLMLKTIALVLKARGLERLPFIWFWPDGARACSIVTHDVETEAGRDFSEDLMDLDDSFGIKSAFQVIPEARYELPDGFLEGFWRRGFEVNVHDLKHDGFLFLEKEEFLRRAKGINDYGRKFRSQGFRAGSMYRNQQWYGAFEFSYDMSVPNVAHLEPQRGGCCTVMPYFVGNILELPLTTIQDYSLFHILRDYTIDIWKQQMEMILERNGLISFITHPDYLIEARARRVYRELLSHLTTWGKAKNLWFALPQELNRWWRNRHQMQLVRDGNQWRIEGPDSDRARMAYASLEGDHVTYSVEEAASPNVGIPYRRSRRFAASPDGVSSEPRYRKSSG